jgi:hypothetical protein
VDPVQTVDQSEDAVTRILHDGLKHLFPPGGFSSTGSSNHIRVFQQFVTKYLHVRVQTRERP